MLRWSKHFTVLAISALLSLPAWGAQTFVTIGTGGVTLIIPPVVQSADWSTKTVSNTESVAPRKVPADPFTTSTPSVQGNWIWV